MYIQKAGSSSCTVYHILFIIHFLLTGGDAKLLMFLCVSPTQQYLGESVRVLAFGSRAQQVQRGPVKKYKTQNNQ